MEIPAVLPFPSEVTEAVITGLEAAAVRALGDRGTRLVVDLGGTTFLGSAGLGLLVKMGKRLSDLGGGLALARARPPVARLLRAVGLVEVLPHFPSVEPALAHLRGRAP